MLGIFAFLKQWMQDSGFRGCAFLNISSEIPMADCELMGEVIKHNSDLRNYVLDIVREIYSSRPGDLALTPEKMAAAVYVLIEGAIVSSQNYSAVWPIDSAQSVVDSLLLG